MDQPTPHYLAKHTGRSAYAVYSDAYREQTDQQPTLPHIQWLTHGDKTALSWAVNSQTRETFWTEMLLEGLPSFPEITVTEAHELEVGRIWKPQKGGTWLCFLKVPSSSTPKDAGGGTGLDSSKSWVLLIHSATSCQSGERKKAKERSGRRNRVATRAS